MNEVISEWVAKAEGDFATASREHAVSENPNYDAVCFHLQQCAEKYMKALMIVKGVVPPKTHDLDDRITFRRSTHRAFSGHLPG